MIITQDLGASITQGYALAPTPTGGLAGGGGSVPLRREPATGYCYLGGLMGEPDPIAIPGGPIVVHWRDDEGRDRLELMRAILQMAEPPPGIEINPGSVGWDQVIAWCPLSELDP